MNRTKRNVSFHSISLLLWWLTTSPSANETHLFIQFPFPCLPFILICLQSLTSFHCCLQLYNQGSINVFFITLQFLLSPDSSHCGWESAFKIHICLERDVILKLELLTFNVRIWINVQVCRVNSETIGGGWNWRLTSVLLKLTRPGTSLLPIYKVEWWRDCTFAG